jgi:GntR family transcriptional regulator, transcriptional repressor for pyruvate dehydrogenase complex
MPAYAAFTVPRMTADPDIAPATGSAVDQIVEAMRVMISDDQLKVGDRLPTERELCERFNASRNTVREAMRMLKAYGVVEVRPKVGATIVDNRMTRALDLFSFNVTELSRQTFADIQGFRELIEVGSVLTIFDAASPEVIAELRAINAGMMACRTVIEAAEEDFRFHTRLVSLVGNKSILDVYQIMKPVILRIMQRGKTRRTIEIGPYREHDSILDAIAARDSLGFQFLMRAHLRAGFAHF